MKHVYTVWFRDPRVPADDPDYEWPAVFIVEAADAFSAKGWGDHLAGRYAPSRGLELLSSTAEPIQQSKLRGLDTVPIVHDGEEATNLEIGW